MRQDSCKFIFVFLATGILLVAPWCGDASAQGIGVSGIADQVDHDAALMGPAVSDAIMNFRAQVESEAFQRTLRLCQAYRQARGLKATPHALGTWDQSTNEWAHVFKQGLWQPYDSMFGFKAEYLSSLQIPMWHLQAWFRSLYVLYFLDSDGFARGAVHCLNTTNLRELRYFAATILSADQFGSLTTEAGLLVASDGVLVLLGKLLRWMWMPLHFINRTLGLKIGRPHLLASGLVIGPILVDNFLLLMQRKGLNERAGREMLERRSLDEATLMQIKTIFLKRGYALVMATVNHPENERELLVYLKSRDFAGYREVFVRDQRALTLKNPRTLQESGYLELLNLILPLATQAQTMRVD